MAVHIHKALDVDEAMMQARDLWHEERQGTELRPFGGEELPRAGVQMFRCRVHLVAEGPGLAIEIGEIRKRAAGEEIVLKEMGAFDTRGAVGIALFARETKPKRSAARHLRGRDHPRPGASRDDDVCVIDHARRGRRRVLQRVGQEDFAVKAREGRVDLEKKHARVAQHE